MLISPRIVYILYSTYLACLIFLLSSCVSVSGFQTARTIGKDTIVVQQSFSMLSTYDFELLRFDQKTDIDSFHTLPVLEVGLRYGIGRKFDIGAKVNTNSYSSLDVKYQLNKDRNSPFAVAIGFGAGAFFLVDDNDGPIYDYQIPLFFSYHPSEKLHIYLTPKYINQFFDDDRYNYLGLNTGVLFGQKHKWGFDFSYFTLRQNKVRTLPIYSIGVGGLFTIPVKQ